MGRAEQIEAAIARVETADQQSLMTMRENAAKYPDTGKLLEAIDRKLSEFQSEGGMHPHRLEFARAMLRIVERSTSTRWFAGRDLFQRARLEQAANPFVIWMAGNSARQIPVTKALEIVRPEFPNIEYRKEGPDQSARVFYRRRLAGT